MNDILLELLLLHVRLLNCEAISSFTFDIVTFHNIFEKIYKIRESK